MYISLWIVIFLSLFGFTVNARKVNKNQFINKLKARNSKNKERGGGGKGSTKVEGHDTIIAYKGKKKSSIPLKTSSLYAHNYLRKRHGVSKLVWDNSLAKSSQDWAKELAKKGKLQHSTGKGSKYGENLGFIGVPIVPIVLGPALTVFKWWHECQKYGFDFKNPDNPKNQAAGHFTQVVWASSKKLGCGAATSTVQGMEKTYLVCQYSPRGNVHSQYKANVRPIKGKKPNSALEIAMEGCSDYGSECSSKKNFCSTEIVFEACCYTCSRT